MLAHQHQLAKDLRQISNVTFDLQQLPQWSLFLHLYLASVWWGHYGKRSKGHGLKLTISQILTQIDRLKTLSTTPIMHLPLPFTFNLTHRKWFSSSSSTKTPQPSSISLNNAMYRRPTLPRLRKGVEDEWNVPKMNWQPEYPKLDLFKHTKPVPAISRCRYKWSLRLM